MEDLEDILPSADPVPIQVPPRVPLDPAAGQLQSQVVEGRDALGHEDETSRWHAMATPRLNHPWDQRSFHGVFVGNLFYEVPLFYETPICMCIYINKTSIYLLLSLIYIYIYIIHTVSYIYHIHPIFGEQKPTSLGHFEIFLVY